MTAQTLDSTKTLSESTTPQRKTYAVEKPRFPLVLKIFVLTGLLIVIVVAIAVGLTIERANRIARETVNTSISAAAKLFKDFEGQRLSRLALTAELLGGDPSFAAYIQKALEGEPAIPDATGAALSAPDPNAAPAAPAQAPAIDLLSIFDQLLERKEQMGSDLLMLLDDQGRIIARTDQPAVATDNREDLYDRSLLVKKIVDDAGVVATTGVLDLNGKLYHAAVAPVATGLSKVRIAYLVNAYSIDDSFANRIGQSTNAGVLFAEAKGSSVSRSSNAPSFGMQQMDSVKQIFATGKMMPPSNITVDRSKYVMTGEPLMAGTQPVGAALFIRSLDRELAPFRQIQRAVLIGGGISLVLAFLLSWLIAKKITRPIEELAATTQAITAGDYSVNPPAGGDDEVGILGRTFASMLTSLRDKAELEELVAEMASKSEAREANAAVRVEVPKQEEGTLLVTDLRGLPIGDSDPARVIEAVQRIMRLQEAEVIRQDGFVREIIGHQMVSVFRGERGIIHAIRAARAINEEIASQVDPGSLLAVGVGIATGEYVSGTVALSQESGLAIVGNAPLLALLFAWHAPSGYAYISYETAQSAGGEVLSSVTREEVRLKWLAQPLPVGALPLVSVTTGMMRSIGATTSSMATLRLDGSTVPGATAPQTGGNVDLSQGQMFAGRYKIDQILGRGGMGVVYRATDTQLDEVVAIKTLPGDVMQRSPEDLERFKREIRLARKITHRNVLRTYDYGEADGVYFISMEFVRGYTLSELMDESEARQLSPRAALGIARQISRGLQAAHEQGIIHRDIKPQNVLIDAKGEVKLMDFGIARPTETPEAMTQAGLIVGTPHYMSPEQVQGKPLDARSDVYSMGVLIYETVVGKRPFESSSLTGILTAHITEKARPPIELRPEIGRELNAIIMRALAKDPKERYADAGGLLEDLDQVHAPSAAAA